MSGSSSSSSENSASLQSETLEVGVPTIPVRLTIDEAIDRLGTGKFQKRLLFSAGMCVAADAMEVLLLSFLAIVVQSEFGVGAKEGAILTSSVFAGAMFGTLIMGRLGDIIGRKPMFLLAATIISTSGMLTALAQSYWVMLIFRFGVGFGLGGVVIPYDTLTEFLPSSERSLYLLRLGYFWTIGTMAVPALAYLGLQEQSSWRMFVLLCSFPCIVSTFFAFLWVPESPRFLVKRGEEDRALEILRYAAELNGKDALARFPDGVVFVEDPNEEKEMDSFWALFNPEWRTTTLAIWGVWAGKSFMYWGTMQLVTLVFSDQNPGDLAVTENYSFDYGAIFASSVAEIVGQTIAIYMVEGHGRIMLQSCLYLLCGIGGVGLCLTASNYPTERAYLICIAFFARMFAMGASNLTWLVTAEILPTQIRNTGHSSACAVARIGGACSPWLVSTDNSFETIAIAFGAISLWTSGMVLLLPETTGMAIGTAHLSSNKKQNIDCDSSTRTQQPSEFLEPTLDS